MNATDQRYRRNFIIALTLHASVIGILISWEHFLSDDGLDQSNSEIIQADILGELPAGDGPGRGLYKAPEPPGPTPAVQAPATAAPESGTAQNTPDDEAPAPAAKAVPQPKAAPDEIAVPNNKASKKPVEESKVAPTASGKNKTTTATAATPAKTAKAKAGSGSGKGSSAEEIRNRFAKALGSSANGTPYGDGRAAGGGTSKSGKIGSPNGLAEGEVGGIGQGTPNARYLQHVHDVLYEAWEQPGSALDKRLSTAIRLRIARDGSIAEASVEIGSGNKLMDDSVLAAVRKVPRLEPPPAILVYGEYAVITVNFSVEG